jgi:hypothetical protein
MLFGSIDGKVQLQSYFCSICGNYTYSQQHNLNDKIICTDENHKKINENIEKKFNQYCEQKENIIDDFSYEETFSYEEL